MAEDGMPLAENNSRIPESGPEPIPGENLPFNKSPSVDA
jgi:hypothetical protein